MPVTTNFAWNMPTVGADTDTWGDELNTLAQDIDTQVFNTNTVAAAALPKAGGTMTGGLILPAGTTSLVPVRIPHGAAHSSLTNGDIWTTTTGFFARINGATKQFASLDGTETFTNKTFTAAILGGTTNLSGGQIAFPASQSASADANTLDDYEEGTYTPVVAFGGASSGITYTTQVGSYIKVGKVVHFSAKVVLSDNGTSTGIMTVSTPAFTSQNTTNMFHAVSVYADDMTYTGSLQATIQPNTQAVNIGVNNNGSATNISDTNTSNTTDITVTGWYRASA